MSSELFVWRRLRPPGTKSVDDYWPGFVKRLRSGAKACPSCETELTPHRTPPVFTDAVAATVASEYQICLLCGWLYSSNRAAEPRWDFEEVSILKEFDLNSAEIGLQELGTHLRRRIADIFGLTPRRFEELAADVFRRNGFQVVLTQTTRDGGADLLLVQEDGTDVQAIVECKRYAETRTVGVSLVRTLVGAAVAWGVRRGILLTTSQFSTDAKDAVSLYEQRGYDIDLFALSELATMLRVYNANLPALAMLSDQDRREIQGANYERFFSRLRR